MYQTTRVWYLGVGLGNGNLVDGMFLLVRPLHTKYNTDLAYQTV